MASEQTPRTTATAAASSANTNDTTTPDTSHYTTAPHATSAPPQVVEHTNSWKPSFGRRQSWNQEDQKRELQMSHIDDVKTGPGFTERA